MVDRIEAPIGGLPQSAWNLYQEFLASGVPASVALRAIRQTPAFARRQGRGTLPDSCAGADRGDTADRK